jgi:DNA-binding transcriptional MerR regulator
MAELLDAKPRTIQFYTDEGLLFTKVRGSKNW